MDGQTETTDRSTLPADVVGKMGLQQVCVQLPKSAVNAALPAIC